MWTSLPVRCYSNDLYSSDSLLTIPSYYSIPFTKDLLKTIYILCVYTVYISLLSIISSFFDDLVSVL